MSVYQIHAFISHSWSYSDHYETLATWIFEEPWQSNGTPLSLVDFSVPRENPIHNANNASELQAAISAQIDDSHVVVIPTGMYAEHSKWIQKEIDAAKALRKPILAVNPWGQERNSKIVEENANATVGWNKKSVIGGIWQLYRA